MSTASAWRCCKGELVKKDLCGSSDTCVVKEWYFSKDVTTPIPAEGYNLPTPEASVRLCCSAVILQTHPTLTDLLPVTKGCRPRGAASTGEANL